MTPRVTTLQTALKEQVDVHRASVGRLFWLVVIVAAVIAVVTNLGELKAIGQAALTARWEFVAAAAGVEVLFVINLSLFYITTFREASFSTCGKVSAPAILPVRSAPRI